MREKRFAPCNLNRATISLGKQGEANHLRIEFDCSGWLAGYPDAVIVLYHFAPERAADNPIRPVLGEEGTDRVWIVSETDTANAGNGVIELVLEDAFTGARIKSATGYTTVTYSPSAVPLSEDGGNTGTGEDGGYYKPSVSSSGDLSWTPSKAGMPSVNTVNIRGPEGKQGQTGYTPQKGVDYFDGAPGAPGENGQAATLEIVDADSLPYGSKPTVTEEAGSTPQARKYRLGIPEGKPGPSGTGEGGSVKLDTTLTQYGQAADAGAVGNAIGQEKKAREQAIEELEGKMVSLDATLTQSGQAADAKATGDELNALKEANAAQDEEIAKRAKDADLAAVAKSGSYNDLTNKPTIPTVPTALKNPYPLTINGTAYDGSKAVDMTIEGGEGTGGTANVTPRMSNIIKAGTIFEKPEGLPYCGWPFNDVQYDPDINSIVFLINAAEKHGDNGKNVLHMGVMNLDTYDVTIKEIGNPDTLGHGFYTMGFCINSAGEYLYVDAQSATLGKSVDKGVTWTETDISAYSTWPESLTQLSNGRYLMWSDSGRGVWYSDDDCANWTQATMSGVKYEGDFLELPDGVVMCFMRKSTNGTDNGAWSGTKIKEPIVVSISRDYGTTWSAATDSTTLLEGCANIASAFYHVDEDLVEVFTSPRYPFGDTYGAVFQYIATREDALNDRFGEPKVVLYSKAHVYQDFGHIGGCFDNLGDLHLMYYDGDGDASGSVNYHYLKASRGQATLPLVNDNSQSVFLPYSGHKVENSLLDAYAYIRKVRTELLIKIGEMPDSGDSENPTYWITDGLIAQFDFSEDNFDSATSSFSVIGNDYKDAKLYTAANDGVYSTSPLVSGTDTSVPLADLIQAAVLDPEAGYTIELDVGALLQYSKDEAVIAGNNFYSWGNEQIPSFSNTTARTYGSYKGKYWRGDNTRKASTISYVLDRVNKRSYLYINGELKLDSVNYTLEDGYSFDVADCYGISNRGNWCFKTWASNFMELGSWDNKALRFYTRPLTAEEVAHNATYTNL